MLRLTDIRKNFGDLVAVDGLNLHVREGEVFGLLGPNGAGKTTTISMAIGLLLPDAGSIDIGGFGTPTNSAVRAKIGVAPQALALYDDLSAQENLEFFGKLYGLSGKSLTDRSTAVLNDVGLESRRKDRVKGYSGGMKRRLNLAVAMLHDPPLLLLDEPTAGVDPQSRNSILDFVKELQRRGRTIVYTTHYMEEAQRLCDRVAIMDHGKLLEVGTVDELVMRHGGKSTVTFQRGDADEKLVTDDPLHELSRVMSGPGAESLTGVHIERSNLESVFLTLTGRSLRD
ncbi:MAG: ABC transporter ATP-binding protein [Phycisphaerales bacterium]